MGKIISPTNYINDLEKTIEELKECYGIPVESHKAYKYLKKLSDKNALILEIAKELNILQDGSDKFFNVKKMSEASLDYLQEKNLSIKNSSPFIKLDLETINILASYQANKNDVNAFAKLTELYLADILFKDERYSQLMLTAILSIMHDFSRMYGNTYFMCSNKSPSDIMMSLVSRVVNDKMGVSRDFSLGLMRNLLTRIKYLIKDRLEKMDLCFIDTETTGLHNILDDNSAKPTQVSYIITDLEGNIKKSRNIFIKQDDIPEKVVQLNGIDLEFLEKNNAISEEAFVKNILTKDLISDDLIFVGHNVTFDLKVLYKSVKRCKDVVTDTKYLDYFDNTDYIDTYIVADKVKNGNKFVKSSLEGLSEYLKIENKNIEKLTNKFFPEVKVNKRHLSHYDVTNQFIFTLKIAPLLNLDKLKYEYELEKETQIEKVLRW